jgi:rhodanese-related sulfurtransferase
MNIPEITVQSLYHKIKTKEQFVILDVREYWEIEKVRLNDKRLIVLPLSQIVKKSLDAFPESAMNKESELTIMCHLGIRSAQVTSWLLMQGWTNVYSLQGGVDAYARHIDFSIGFY